MITFIFYYDYDYSYFKCKYSMQLSGLQHESTIYIGLLNIHSNIFRI